jgi:hypothetical protein
MANALLGSGLGLPALASVVVVSVPRLRTRSSTFSG